MSTPERKAKTAELREAGALAFREGRHIQTCPHTHMDAFQWMNGWYDAEGQSQSDGEVKP